MKVNVPIKGCEFFHMDLTMGAFLLGALVSGQREMVTDRRASV